MTAIDDIYQQVTTPILNFYFKSIKAFQPIGETLLKIVNHKKVEYFKINEWYFAALAPTEKSPGWMIWCAKVPLTSDDPIKEPEKTEIWVNLANTKEQAIFNLKQEVGIDN